MKYVGKWFSLFSNLIYIKKIEKNMSNSVIYVVYQMRNWKKKVVRIRGEQKRNIDYTKIEKYHAICIRQIDMIVEMNDNGMTCLWKNIYIMNNNNKNIARKSKID